MNRFIIKDEGEFIGFTVVDTKTDKEFYLNYRDDVTELLNLINRINQVNEFELPDSPVNRNSVEDRTEYLKTKP